MTIPDVRSVPHNWTQVGYAQTTPLPNPYIYFTSDVVDVGPGVITTLTIEWPTSATVKIFGVAGFSQDLGPPIYVGGWQGCVNGSSGRCGNQFCGFGMVHCQHAGNPFNVPLFLFDPATNIGRVSWCFANEGDISRQAFFKLIAAYDGASGGEPSKPGEWDGPALPDEAKANNWGLTTRFLAGGGLRRSDQVE